MKSCSEAYPGRPYTQYARSDCKQRGLNRVLKTQGRAMRGVIEALVVQVLPEAAGRE